MRARVAACPTSGGGLPRGATRYHPCTDPSVVGSGQAEGWIAQSLARDQSDDDVDDVDDGDEDVGDDDDDVSGADG